jgi:methylmalonyl-CoA mutase
MSENLFDDFSPVSSKLWKQKIQYELKGADYNNTLVWESPEGIKVKPFYHSDEAKEPLSVTTQASQFKICQDIFVHDVDKSNARAVSTLKRGAEAIRFTIADASVDVKKLVSGISPSTPVYFYLLFLEIDFVKAINGIAGQNNATYYVQLDPIAHLVKEGNWMPGKDNFETLNAISSTCANISFLSINAGIYQNGGANIVQQIAYTLAHANEYFNSITALNKPITIQLAVGTNYFFEIAKIRVTKILFALIANEYGHNEECHIIATPTKRNKTLYDYNVNMLRTTTECMSAILGGADVVINQPYDSLYHKSNEFGDRIARNQLLVLKHESYFNAVNNPADGAYYIEELTQQLVEKAFTLFKEIEAAGGFLSQLKESKIQKKIYESAVKEQELFDTGKEVLLGTNRHPNINDRMSHDLELFPFVKLNPRKTLISPVIEKRLSEKMEQERLQNEKVNSEK